MPIDPFAAVDALFGNAAPVAPPVAPPVVPPVSLPAPPTPVADEAPAATVTGGKPKKATSRKKLWLEHNPSVPFDDADKAQKAEIDALWAAQLETYKTRYAEWEATNEKKSAKRADKKPKKAKVEESDEPPTATASLAERLQEVLRQSAETQALMAKTQQATVEIAQWVAQKVA